jgi:hypothetical protein
LNLLILTVPARRCPGEGQDGRSSLAGGSLVLAGTIAGLARSAPVRVLPELILFGPGPKVLPGHDHQKE